MSDLLRFFGVFCLSLALTLLIEWLVSLVFKLQRCDLGLFVLVNLLTNPAAVFLNILFCMLFPYVSAFAWQIPLELTIVAVEGIIYCKMSRSLHLPWIYALAANMLSYTIGLILI